MQIRAQTILFFALTTILLLTSCTTSHQITREADVLESGKFSGSYGLHYNLPMNTIVSAGRTIAANINATYKDSGTVVDKETLTKDMRYLTDYAVDPISLGNQVGMKVGVGHGFDLGFRYGGGMLYEIGYSLWKEPTSQATLALQYSQSEYKLPSSLEKLQDILSLEFKRKDFVMPLIMGRKFGENGKYGGIQGGPVLGFTRVSYGFDPKGIYQWVAESGKTPLPSIPTQEVKYFSYGLNGSLKVGYKHVFALISFSSYYQNYGTYELPGVGTHSPSGLTMIPYFGVVVQ